MKTHNVKCYYCGNIFDANKEQFVKVNSTRYAHKSCQEERDKVSGFKEAILLAASSHAFTVLFTSTSFPFPTSWTIIGGCGIKKYPNILYHLLIFAYL